MILVAHRVRLESGPVFADAVGMGTLALCMSRANSPALRVAHFSVVCAPCGGPRPQELGIVSRTLG
jgi:hypothetical protein